MLWNAAWYLSSGYERNDPRGPESRVYGVVWEIATVQQCLFHAGSTRKHRGKGCRNLFLKELGTDSFRSALSHTYCTQSPLYFLSLSIRLSIFLWFIETIERKADLVEIFFRRNRRFCWNSKSLKSVGESLFYNIFLEKKHCFFKCKKITFRDYTRMNHLFLLGFLSNRIFLREQLSRSKYEYSLRARENRVVES